MAREIALKGFSELSFNTKPFETPEEVIMVKISHKSRALLRRLTVTYSTKLYILSHHHLNEWKFFITQHLEIVTLLFLYTIQQSTIGNWVSII